MEWSTQIRREEPCRLTSMISRRAFWSGDERHRKKLSPKALRIHFLGQRRRRVSMCCSANSRVACPIMNSYSTNSCFDVTQADLVLPLIRLFTLIGLGRFDGFFDDRLIDSFFTTILGINARELEFQKLNRAFDREQPALTRYPKRVLRRKRQGRVQKDEVTTDGTVESNNQDAAQHAGK